jgi:hypothetical protein
MHCRWLKRSPPSRRLVKWGLAHPCATTARAAPPFAVFEGWALPTAIKGDSDQPDKFDVPTLAKDARVGQPLSWKFQEHNSNGWASPPGAPTVLTLPPKGGPAPTTRVWFQADGPFIPEWSMCERKVGRPDFDGFSDGEDLFLAESNSSSRLLVWPWWAIVNGEVTFHMD